jgi:hypothetical protein
MAVTIRMHNCCSPGLFFGGGDILGMKGNFFMLLFPARCNQGIKCYFELFPNDTVLINEDVMGVF